jgi:hypothetical protein
MFSSIIDPYTKTKLSLFGQEGGKLLENYIKVYKHIRQMGGKKSSEKKNKLKEKEPHDLADAVLM